MLGTPPAFILSQDQTLMFKIWFRSKIAWLIFKPYYCCLVFLFWMFSRTSRLNQKPLFFKNFQGFTYCSVFKVLCCWMLSFVLSSNFYILSQLLLFVNNFFHFFEFLFLNRRSFSAAWISYHNSQSVSTLFSNYLNIIFNRFFSKMKTEKEGFEPSRRLPDLHP